jgi:hypothetical protein
LQLLFFYYKKNKKFFPRVFSLPISPYFSTVFYRPLFKQTLAFVAVFLHFHSGQSIAVPLCPFWPSWPSLVVCLLLYTVHVNVRGILACGMCPPTACVESVRTCVNLLCTLLLTYAFMCSTMVLLRKPLIAWMQH